MQDVILEILELIVGRLGAFEVELGVGQKYPLPQVVVRACDVAQRIQRQLVMGALGVGGIDDAEEQVHGRFPSAPARAQPGKQNTFS